MPDESPSRSVRRCGDYELLEKIGQGGMSSVYKARDPRSNKTVAVKVASRLVMNDAQLSRRFEMEYALAHPLKHPNLVKVLANGTHDYIPYLVMEYIDGPSLSDHLKTHERLSENDALAIILPIADALTYLHKKQIVHRDIKPANILLTSTGEAKLADLGLIKNLESVSQLTRSNFGLGTMQFAAPEQFDNARSADVRSDVYSLAATLYLMLTGEYPFGKGAVMNVLERKLQNKFDAPIRKIPHLRNCVDVAIRLALDAERERRPASIDEFASFLTGEKKTRPAITPPGKMPPPRAKPKASRKTGKENRSQLRYALELDATCRAVTAAQRWASVITDLSLAGLCMDVKRRFEVGSVLEVSFALEEDGSTMNQLARVRWHKVTEAKSWLLGCEFVNAITDDDLNSIVVDRMDKTRML